MKQSINQLLVHLDATAHGKERLDVARLIAQGQGAAVCALYAVTPSLLALPFAGEAGASAAAMLQEVDEDRRRAARAVFESVAATEGPRVAWAETQDLPVIASFTHQALYADLLVLGQYDISDPAFAGVPPDFVESVLAQSGKPAVVVPYAGVPAAMGDTVVIAWKATRETARAVAAAVPLLQRARRVYVLSWGGEAPEVHGDSLSLKRYLKQIGRASCRERV